MNKNAFIIIVIVLVGIGLGWLLGSKGARAQDAGQSQPAPQLADMGTGFTYQGRLVDGNSPAAGIYDFQFSLFDAASFGSQIGVTQSINNLSVIDGLFTVVLSFGADVVNGQARWLEIAVKRDADGSYTSLSPRTALTPAPHALALPGLWTQQNATSPNLVGGYNGNVMGAGVTGGVIAGGGESASSNRVYDNNGAVGGGRGNVVGIDDGDSTNQTFITVGGGADNQAKALGAVVGGGVNNSAASSYSVISGGYLNQAVGPRTTVGGGEKNVANGSYSVVSGGYENDADGGTSVVSGGEYNNAGGDRAVIGGGSYNLAAASYATISGGGPSDTANPTITNNRVYDDYGTIGGGGGNVVGEIGGINTTYATVGGGLDNTARGGWSTVSGGNTNVAYGFWSAIGGGLNNRLWGAYDTVAGGRENTTALSQNYNTIAGGWSNTTYGDWGAIGGGVSNLVSDLGATVSGGRSNHAIQGYATVGGGLTNTANADYSTIPGGNGASAIRYGEMAYASGPFADSGDAQTSLYVLRQQTSNATLTEMFLDGSSERITLADNRVMTFDMLVVATHLYSSSAAGYQVTGVIRNINGTTSFVGTPVVTTLGENLSGWDVQVTADDTLDALVVKVQGSAGTTIRWVASVRTVEAGR